MKTLLACFLLMSAFASLNSGQTQQPKSSKIESSMRLKEPEWVLSKTEAQSKSTIYRWNSGQEGVVAEVFVTASPAAAAAKFREFKRRVPVPPKEKLKRLGDEALLWQSENTKGCMILFRRSNVFIHINGTLLIDAQRFAGHLDAVVEQQ